MMLKLERLLLVALIILCTVKSSWGGGCRRGGGHHHHGGGDHHHGGGHHHHGGGDHHHGGGDHHHGGGDHHHGGGDHHHVEGGEHHHHGGGEGDHGEESEEDCDDHDDGGGGGGFKPPIGAIVGAIAIHGIEYTYAPYYSWSGQVSNSNPFFITYPKNSQQVVRVVLWASTSGRNVRVQGYKLSFSPLTVGPLDDPAKTVIIDMTKYLTNMIMSNISIPSRSGIPSILNTIVVQAGASIDALLTFAEANGFGVINAPVHDATVGGVLAVAGHGSSIPALNEKLKGTGYSFGSLSNLIVELKAVVLDPATGRWGEKTFSRWDPEIGAFLVHLGRAVITEVTLMVGKNYNMRCLSRVDVPASEMLAHPSNSRGGFRTLAKFINEVGRADLMWFPFTDNPWLKLWIVRRTKPSDGTAVDEPYNYQFPTSEVNPQTPGSIFGPQAFRNLMLGLTKNDVWDIWGPSKNTILNWNMSASPLVYSGLVVLTSRANIQLIFYELALFYTNLINEFGAQSIFPIDQFFQLRVTGLDDPFETKIPNAVPPLLSPLSPVPSRPDWDVGVWMGTFTTTGRPWSAEFMRRFEEWAYATFDGRTALARPEWSKNWGYSANAPFDNPDFIQQTIPKYIGVSDWNQAIGILNKYDPNYVISNQFLKQLMVPYSGNREADKIITNVEDANDNDEDDDETRQ